MKISVAIPNYNDAKHLEQAIRSICSQSLPPHEVICFDDCSTDDSLKILERMEKEYPTLFRYVLYPQKSKDWQAEFLSNVFKHTTGDYVVMASANDVIYPGLIEAVSAIHSRYPKTGVFFSNYNSIDEEGEVLKENHSGVLKPVHVDQEKMTQWLTRGFQWFESGVAAVVRRDSLRWLIDQGACKMGPWSDSIGLTAVGLRDGAVYLSGTYGGFRASPDQYCNTAMYKTEDPFHFCEQVKAFLDWPAVSPLISPLLRSVLLSRSLFTMAIKDRKERYLQEMVPHAKMMASEKRLDLVEGIYRNVWFAFLNMY